MRKKVNHQDPSQRIKNFFEVALGLSPGDAKKEAERCLQCKNKPCMKGCPVEIDIPAFIQLIKVGKSDEALAKIKEKNFLPAVCGRVCPQENQCEEQCVLNKKNCPINIGALERYAADHGKVSDTRQPQVIGRNSSVKVAVIGSGPSGLTCAADLAKLGYSVTDRKSVV